MHRLHLEAVSDQSQHAQWVNVAAKVLADNMTALMCLAAQADARLPAKRRCQRTHAAAAVRTMLPRVLLAVGDVLGSSALPSSSALAPSIASRQGEPCDVIPTGPELVLGVAAGI